MGHRSIWIFGFFSILILSIQISPIYAVSIEPGYDLFSTPPGGIFYFFDHHQQKHTIILEGTPIAPGSSLGNTDTIVQRVDGLPSGGLGTFHMQLVELSLKSVQPVQIDGNFFDVFVTINDLNLPNLPQNDQLAPSMGQVTITGNNIGGGTFTSFFDVFAEITLVPPGVPPTDTNAIHMPLPDFPLVDTGAQWQVTPPTNYPTDQSFPGNGFFTGPITFGGIHPILPAVQPTSSIPDFPFSYSLVIMFVAVAAVYVAIRQGIMPNFKRY